MYYVRIERILGNFLNRKFAFMYYKNLIAQCNIVPDTHRLHNEHALHSISSKLHSFSTSSIEALHT